MLSQKATRRYSRSEAIRLATEHVGYIHLFKTDVVMPEMNGGELSKHLQAIHPRWLALLAPARRRCPVHDLRFSTVAYTMSVSGRRNTDRPAGVDA